MKWISNGDPPIYVWLGDCWFNQKDKLIYFADTQRRFWYCFKHEVTLDPEVIPFPKKARIMKNDMQCTLKS